MKTNIKKSKELKKQIVSLLYRNGFEFNKFVPEIRDEFFRELFTIVNRYTDQKFKL